MSRVRVIVEGPTEESFVSGPLYSALVPYGVFLHPIVLGVPGHKGGNVKYQRVKSDILRTLKQDPTAYCSTLFDLYGLGEGFPAQSHAIRLSGAAKAEFLEQSILQDLIQDIPQFRPDVRFIPYIQPYEFEGLLFSDPTALAKSMFRADLEPHLRAIRNKFETPEDINDSPESAPSKRILHLNHGYSKVISGTLAAEEMGIDVIIGQCPRFRSWFDKLAALGAGPGIPM
jgi:hypothetical protein